MPAFPHSPARVRLIGVLLCAVFALSFAAIQLAAHGAESPFNWSSASYSTEPTSGPAELGPGLAALARQEPHRQVEVIVGLRGDAAGGRRAVTAAGGMVVKELPIIDGLAARMSARSAVELAAASDVRAISLNAEIESTATIDASALATAYNQSIRADRAWALGATGKGVGVAVIDTGVAGDLADFRTAGASRVTVSAVVNPAARNASDTFGHGTHVGGVVAGNGWERGSGDALAGRYIGVAPEASLISVKVDDGHGKATVLDLIDGLQFVLDHKSQFNIRVVNLSVRSTQAQSYKTDPLDAAVERLWLKGVVVVAAAGNLGTAADAVSYAPANDPYVITVGAVDDHGTKSTSDDTIAPWSSRGVTQDGFVKPDVLAPGSHMVSTLSPGSDYATECPSCVTDGVYLRLGGTSMAAAAASGAAAAVLSVHPDWTPDQVKSTLYKRTRPVLAPGSDATYVDADGTVKPADTTDATTISQGEIALDKVLLIGNGSPEAPANGGLTPSTLIDPATGDIIDQTGSWAAGSWGAGSWGAGSWAAGSWTAATGDLVAPWAEHSYIGAPLNPDGFVPEPINCIQLDRSGWSAGSWGAGSWSSEQLTAAHDACDAAAEAEAGSWGAGSWGAGSWGAGSWGAGSWGAGSWAAGSWSTSFEK